MARGKLRGEKPDSVGIKGREYKLLLDPKEFRGPPSDEVPEAFWKRLKHIIDEALDRKDGGASRAEGMLTCREPRHVAFLDTKKQLLDEHDFALRVRTDLKDGKPDGAPEVTLKFRSPDLLLTNEYRQVVTVGRPTIEEDIAPLQVARDGKPIAVADPPSLYSRYAISTKFDTNVEFKKVEDAAGKFKWLDSWLAQRTGGDYGEAKLNSGPTICEWIFEDAFVYLGDGVKAEFTLTLWYLQKDMPLKSVYKDALSGDLDPRIAEISFDFGIDAANGARMDAEAAERAAALFIAMQKLPMDRKETSKTKLGLPDRK